MSKKSPLTPATGPGAVGHDLDGGAPGHDTRGEQVGADAAGGEVDLDDVAADPARGRGGRELAMGDAGRHGLRREQLVEHLAARDRRAPAVSTGSTTRDRDPPPATHRLPPPTTGRIGSRPVVACA